MTLIGLILALLAGCLLWSRWEPGIRPSEVPQARPTQAIDRARESAAQFDALQKRQADQVDKVIQE
jgi:hypothetical protein